jgi:hypothetical protein
MVIEVLLGIKAQYRQDCLNKIKLLGLHLIKCYKNKVKLYNKLKFLMMLF